MAQFLDILASGLVDDSGNALASGTVTTYLAGTTTLQTIYQDADLEDPHPNPATLDATGRLYAYANQKIKIVIANSANSTIRTLDHVGHASSGLATSDIQDDAITGAKLAAAVAGNGLTQDASGNLDVNVDDSTIEINSDQLRVKADSIGASELDESADVEFNTVKIDASGPTLSYNSTTYLGVDKPIIYTDTGGNVTLRSRASNRINTTANNIAFSDTAGPQLASNDSDILLVRNSSGTAQGTIVVGDDTTTTGFRILSGTVTFSAATSAAVTFSGAGFPDFSVAPHVVVTSTTAGSPTIYYSTSAPTTSGFTVYASSGSSETVKWVAYGRYT